MKKIMITCSFLGLVILNSCGGKSDAVEVSGAKEATTVSEEAITYNVDSEMSLVNWRGYKIYEGKTEEEGHYGIVKVTEGEVSVKDGKLESGTFVLDMNTFESIDLEDDQKMKAKLDDHLKNKDFLDVANYPKATFTITSINYIEGEDQNTEITGNLNLRGIEKNIPFKAQVTVTDEEVKIQSENFFISRDDFGSKYVMKNGLLKDDVSIQIDVTTTIEN